MEYYMAFIKAQKIIRDDSGRIISGSAAIVDAVYVSTGTKSHSKQQVREKLGRVLYLSDDKKEGVFQSPTRGLVEYNASSDSFSAVDKNDPRINTEELFPEPEIHTVLGMRICSLSFWKNAACFPFYGAFFQKMRHMNVHFAMSFTVSLRTVRGSAAITLYRNLLHLMCLTRFRPDPCIRTPDSFHSSEMIK